MNSGTKVEVLCYNAVTLWLQFRDFRRTAFSFRRIPGTNATGPAAPDAVTGWREVGDMTEYPWWTQVSGTAETSDFFEANLRTFTQRSPMFSISGTGLSNFNSFVRWKCVLRGWRGGMPVIPQRKCVYSLLICLNFNFTIWQTTLNGLFNNFFSVPQNLTLCQQIMRKESAVIRFFLFYLHDSFAGLTFLWSSFWEK